ncbi:HAMP domain-containing protein [Rhodovarius crocodyli]|uniref:histidine kinase n=1 Tax=Rhodovarius crocodyli TaxID=1979269 RepID=A0A437M288_9PROT|nr:ATP-binding protein [Rhodovarius crocodyli]RVT91624.1 HAMP domain-containing protein [Rhodovarius crocodyli]
MKRALSWIWPDKLAGRATLALLAGLLALHVASVWIHEASLRGRQQTVREQVIATDLRQVWRALASIRAEGRDAAAHALSGPGLELHWREGAAPPDQAGTEASLSGFRRLLLRHAPELTDVRLDWADSTTRHLLVGALPVDAAGYVAFAAPMFRHAEATPFDPDGFAALATMALVIAIVSVVVMRGLTQPLRELSAAADRIGRDGAAVRIAESGPAEIRQAARAFNAMQDRIRRLLDDRTQALAAVSHDLRTPITRLRLVAGFIENGVTRERVDANLDDMAAMVEATLLYMRDGRDAEAPRPTDLATVLRTLCDDAADAGEAVTYSGPEQAVTALRPVAMRRALGNLLGNALAYGGSAEVRLIEAGASLRVEVSDRGPGIPEAAQEVVFEPFRRLEASRNRATGGVGLGLTIARRAVEAEGGTLRLRNRRGGGLTAVVELPLAAV